VHCEVVAVRWSCFSCDATVIAAPGELPSTWFEKPAPLWRAHHDPSYYCPDHADRGRDLHRRQIARYEKRTHVVSVEEYERTRQAIQRALALLDQLKFSGERAAAGKLSR